MIGSMTAEPRQAVPAESYEAAKRVARGGDEKARLALAVSPATPPELLYFLAGDHAPYVRGAVAANVATPPQADRRLADDADPRIRALLGRKLAPIAGRLAADAQDRLHGLAWQTLLHLAADLAVAVRAVIAEEVKDLPEAPRELILKLAHDAAMDVAEPVIRCSPVLTEDDLLALVRHPPVPETVIAVARRPDLGPAIADAVVHTTLPAAVAALLENPTACIREATLDALVAGAARQVGWQPSLVHRPELSPASMRALAAAVADHLLEPLAARPDIDPEAAALLRRRVAERTLVPAEPPAPTDGAVAFAEAAERGDRYAMRRVLAKAAKVSPALVERAERLRSAKGLLGLSFAAGFPPALGLLAQTMLAGLAPDETLPPDAAGHWPISEDELRWQLNVLGGGTGAARAGSDVAGTRPPA